MHAQLSPRHQIRQPALPKFLAARATLRPRTNTNLGADINIAAQETLQPRTKAKRLRATSATPFELRYSQNQVEKVRA
jgi:hypothetical protein